MNDQRSSAAADATGGEREVASLIGLAGRAQRLPESVVSPVREAAREAWRAHVRRTRRRHAAVIAALAAGLLLVSALTFRLLRSESESRIASRIPAPAAPAARLELSFGIVDIISPPGANEANGQLLAGTVITTGEAGGAALRLAGGSSLRVDAGTTVQLRSATGVRLARGALYVDSGDDHPAPGAIVIATALGVVTDVGTQFEVRLLDDRQRPAAPPIALQVRVREGAVEVARDGALHAAGGGTELVVQADGETRRTPALASGATWDWVERTAPALPIEGTSLAAFLDWAGRESGLRWRVVGTPPLAPEDVVLHGSIAGMTIEEALAVVLPGAGFSYRRSAGELLLEPQSTVGGR